MEELKDKIAEIADNYLRYHDLMTGEEVADKILSLIEKTDGGAEVPCSGVLSDADSYAYKNIEEYEGIVDCKVNEAFRIGWSMARATMKQLRALGGEEEGR
ncbi:hypothetical protein KAR91_52525 [Candidatus Pacearchaeota archaeon]|nr:hypothetical protein [Candidatus Pacearchaeota archaeon]